MDVDAASLDLGNATPPPRQACESDVVAVALSQTHQWTLYADTLRQGDVSIALGDTRGTDVAAGYGASAFVLDGRAGAIVRVDDTTVVPFVRHATLEGARGIVRIGGRLFVAAPAGVHAVSLGTGELSTVRADLDALDLTVDDIGALLVLTGDRLVRMLPSGEDAPLSNANLDARRIAFDLTTAEVLSVDDAGVIERTAYGSLVPDGGRSRPVQHGDMGPFLLSDYILAGAEYWPHRGSTPAKYPEEILWGFYPHEGEVFEGSVATATATTTAIGCAEQSFEALKAWIPTAADDLARATATGKAPRFYLWVNDYSEADDPFPAEMREAKLWYWARSPGVPGRIPGYFKWETVVDQGGNCRWPDAEQAAAFLRDAAR